MTFASIDQHFEDYERERAQRRVRDAQYVIPRWDTSGHVVLDVGCGDGRHLKLPELSMASLLLGVDVDRDAIERGRKQYAMVPGIFLHVAPAEHLPISDNFVDTAYSKVALPYTDIRTALAELRRVLKTGGRLQLTMHDWRLQLKFMAESWKHPKRWLDYLYIAYASTVFAWRGRVPARPWNRSSRETFQTRRAMRRELRRAGFEVTRMERNTRQWIIEALAIETP